jgi:hypothetical protein
MTLKAYFFQNRISFKGDEMEVDGIMIVDPLGSRKVTVVTCPPERQVYIGQFGKGLKKWKVTGVTRMP